MAIANGTFVSFCNQPKAHYLATSRKSRRYVVRPVAFGYVKRVQGTFSLPWVRPWDNRDNVIRIEREFNAYQKSRSMYPSIFNNFPVIQAVSLNVRHFSTFCTFLPPTGVALAIRHRLSGISTYGLNGLGNGDEHPA